MPWDGNMPWTCRRGALDAGASLRVGEMAVDDEGMYHPPAVSETYSCVSHGQVIMASSYSGARWQLVMARNYRFDASVNADVPAIRYRRGSGGVGLGYSSAR